MKGLVPQTLPYCCYAITITTSFMLHHVRMLFQIIKKDLEMGKHF